MKTITIIGLIDNIGGREIETRNIIKALSVSFNVRVVSLFFMTPYSEAIKGLNCNWTNIYLELSKSNFLLRLISFILKIYHKRKTPSYYLIDNKISRKLFNITALKYKILKNEIDKTDAVLYCGTLHLYSLNEMIKYCNKVNKPIVLRTTGKVKTIQEEFKKLIPLVDTILVHSLSNATLLKQYNPKFIEVIDQTTLKEKQLLEIPIEAKKELVFGFLGRFSKEKGIIELLNTFGTLNRKIIIAGSGPLLDEVEKLLNPNITFIGTLKPERITDFFKQIDVLIIPSFEEAGPLVGVEAMAAGKIILSTKVGAMMDRLTNTDNNFWFDINKEETLIDEINLIESYSPQDLYTIRKCLRQHYLDNYALQKISKQYIDVLNEVLH